LDKNYGVFEDALMRRVEESAAPDGKRLLSVGGMEADGRQDQGDQTLRAMSL